MVKKHPEDVSEGQRAQYSPVTLRGHQLPSPGVEGEGTGGALGSPNQSEVPAQAPGSVPS